MHDDNNIEHPGDGEQSQDGEHAGMPFSNDDEESLGVFTFRIDQTTDGEKKTPLSAPSKWDIALFAYALLLLAILTDRLLGSRHAR